MRIYGKDIDIQGEGANANISLSFSRTNMFSFGMDIPKCQILQPPITPMADYCCKYPAVIAGGVGLPVMSVCVNAISKSSVNLCIETAANGDVPIYELFKDNIICGCCRPVTPAVTDALHGVGMQVYSLPVFESIQDCITGGYAGGCLFYEPLTACEHGMCNTNYAITRDCYGIVCSVDLGLPSGWDANGESQHSRDVCWPKFESHLIDVNDYTFAWKWNNFVECASCWWECNCGVPIRGVPDLGEDVAIVFPNTRELYLCAPWSMCEWSGGCTDVVCLQCYNWAYAPIGFCLCGNPTEVCSGYRRMNCGAELFICDAYGWRVWYEYSDSCSAICCGGGICCYRYGLLHLYYASDMPKAQCVLCCVAEQFWNEFEYQVYEDGCSIGNCGFGVSCTACSNNCLALSSFYSPSLPLFCYCLSYMRLRCNCTIDYYGAYNVREPVGYVNNSCIGCYSTSIASFGDEYFCPHASCRYCERVVVDGGWTTQIGQEDSMCYGCVCLPWIGNFFGCGVIDTIRRVVTTLGCYMNGADVYSPSGKTFAINCALDYCVYNCSIYQCGYVTAEQYQYINCSNSSDGATPLLGQLAERMITEQPERCLPIIDPYAQSVTYECARLITNVNMPYIDVACIGFHAQLVGCCSQFDFAKNFAQDTCCIYALVCDCGRTEIALAKLTQCGCGYGEVVCAEYNPVVCGDYGKGYAAVGLSYPMCYRACISTLFDGVCAGTYSYDVNEREAAKGYCWPMYRCMCQPSKLGVRNNAVTLTTQPSDTNTILSNGVGSCFVWNGARYRIERIDNYNPTAATCLKVFGVMV